MRLLPRSAFGQTVLLIGVLLLINQVVSYLGVTYYFVRPSYQQMSGLIADHVQVIVGEKIHERNPAEREAFYQRTGIRIVDDQQAITLGLEKATHYSVISNPVSRELNRNAEVFIGPLDRSQTEWAVWVTLESVDRLWVVIPLRGVSGGNIAPVTMILMVIGVLSVLGGWLFVRRVNRPLKALEAAALAVSRGHFPRPLRERGTSEMMAVTTAFNRMSRGIKQLEDDLTLMTAGISHDLRTPLTRIRLAT